MVSHFTKNIIVSLSLIGLCAGCSIPRIQDKTIYTEIQAGKRAVVLLRLTHENVSGITNIDAFSSGVWGGMGLGGFDTGGEVKPVAATVAAADMFLSQETAHRGWIYLVLKPGTYYLAFLGPRVTSAFTYYDNLKTAQRWSIDIPVGSRLIYGGTVHLLCRKVTVGFSSRCVQARQAGVVKNEEALAVKVAEQHLPELGAPKTLLLKSHRGEPIVIKKPK